jgi:hypothetical protein
LPLWGHLGWRHFGRWVNALLNSHAGSTDTILRGQERNAMAIGGSIAGVPDGADDSVAKNIRRGLDNEGGTSNE